MTSKQAATIFQALASRHSYSYCSDCGVEGELTGADKLCRSCALDAQYQMSGEARPMSTFEPEHYACWRCGAGVNGDDAFCEDCYGAAPMTSEERYDSDAEAGADDWKGDEGR